MIFHGEPLSQTDAVWIETTTIFKGGSDPALYVYGNEITGLNSIGHSVTASTETPQARQYAAPHH